MGWPWQPAQLSHPRPQNPLGLFRVGKPTDKTPRIPALLWWYRPQDGFNVHPRAWRWGEDPSEVMWFSSDECEKFTYGRGEHPCWFLCPFVGTVPNGKSNTIIITSNHKRQVCVCVCAHASVCACAARTLLSTVLYVLPEEMLGLLQNSHKSQTYSLVFTFFFLLFLYRAGMLLSGRRLSAARGQAGLRPLRFGCTWRTQPLRGLSAAILL